MRINKKSIRSIILVTIFFLLDLIGEYPVFGVFAGITLIFYLMNCLLRRLIGGSWQKLREATFSIILVSILILGSLSIYFVNEMYTSYQLDKIISALCEYKKDNLHYPKGFGQIVPDYIASIPKPRLFSLSPFSGPSKFEYIGMEKHHVIRWSLWFDGGRFVLEEQENLCKDNP